MIKAGMVLRLIGWALWPALLTVPSGAGAQTPEESWGCASAAYFGPTDEYRHGVLGDELEYKGLYMSFYVDDSRGEIAERRITLPKGQVFEDLAPRCADFNGDGAPDPVTIISDARQGARLAIFVRGEIAWATPPIGQGYRWLAPVGIADLSGDGRPDIAYVETPHIGGTLRVWTVREGRLVQIASKGGFSNHRIGQSFITGGVRDCGNGPELVLPNFNWSQLVAVSLHDNTLSERAIAVRTDKRTVAAALECRI